MLLLFDASAIDDVTIATAASALLRLLVGLLILLFDTANAI